MNLYIFAEYNEIKLIESNSNIELIKEIIINNQFKHFQKISFYKYKNKKFAIAISGVGKVNSSLFLTYLLTKYKFKNVINIGPAGSNDEKIGDSFICEKAYYKDVDLTALPNYEIGQLPNLNKYFYTNNILNNKIAKILKLEKYKIVATQDKFQIKNDIKNNDDQLYDMECSTLAHVSSFFDIPFSSIKIVSDNKNSNEYKKNVLIWKSKIYNIFVKLLQGI